MSEARSKEETPLVLVSAAVPLLCLGSEVAVYPASDDAPDGEPGHEVAGAFISSATQERSKRYQHAPGMYGGKEDRT